MKTSMRFLLMSGLLTLGSFVTLIGCGDDTEETTTGAASNPATTSASSGTGEGGQGGAGGGGEGGQGGAGGGEAGLSCEAYCGITADACKDDNAQYPAEPAGTCLGFCKATALGEKTDGTETGNTVACRQYHAGAAKMSAAIHCPHAGPSGGNACGTPCEAFCGAALKTCTGAQQAFADETACMAECGAFPGLDMTPYSAKVTTGNSLACRLYHLTVATADPATHCPHIKTDSPVCK